jgi:DNA invertase Pin-like site-specific DNA recombinase
MLSIDVTQFKELLDQRYTQEQLAAKFNCSVDAIKKYKRANGLVGYKTNKKPLTERDIVFLTHCADTGKGYSESCRLLGISMETVSKYIPKELHTRLTSNSRRALSDMHRIGTLKNFLVPSAETAYFVGLLQADGCISKDGVVSLTSKDRELILPFARFIQANVVNTGTGFYSSQVKEIKLTSKFQQVSGIFNNKTYTGYKVPAWIEQNEEFFWNFIVGVFNGDGSVAPKGLGAQLQIEQHSSQSEFIKKLGKFLGWPIYLYDYAKIQTSSRKACEEFFKLYSNNEYAMIRKIIKLESLLY